MSWSAGKKVENGANRNTWADYDGQYDAYNDIDWEAQDHSP